MHKERFIYFLRNGDALVVAGCKLTVPTKSDFETIYLECLIGSTINAISGKTGIIIFGYTMGEICPSAARHYKTATVEKCAYPMSKEDKSSRLAKQKLKIKHTTEGSNHGRMVHVQT